MSVDPVATRRFIDSLSTHLEDHLAAWKSALADTRSEVTDLLNAMAERIPAQAKPLFPEDIVSMMLEDVLPPPPEPQRIVERVVEKVVETVTVPGPASAVDWALVKGSLAAVESARTQVDVLTRFLTEANSHASRVALLVLRNDRVTGWKALGFDASGGRDDVVKSVDFAATADPFLASVLKTERPAVAVPPAEGSPFRRALGGRAPARTFAVPMVIRDRVAGLLCADELPGEDGRLNEAALEVLTFVTGLAVDLLAARKKIPSPSLTPRGEAVTVFVSEPSEAPTPARESLHERELGVPPSPPPSQPAPTRPAEPVRPVPPPPPDFEAARHGTPAPAPKPLSLETGPGLSELPPTATPLRSAAPAQQPPPPPPPPAGPGLEVELPAMPPPTAPPDFSLGRSGALRTSQELTDPAARAKRRITDAGEALRALEESATAKKKGEVGGPAADLLFGTIRTPVAPAPPSRVPPLELRPAAPQPPPPAPPTPPITPVGDLTMAFEQIKGSMPAPPPAPPLPPVAARESSAPRPMPVPPPASPLEGGLPGSAPIAPPAGFVPRARALRGGDDPQRAFEDARRLARLLVSEIKLYNERTPESVRSGADFFRDEIIRVLAEGKADALGQMP